MTKSAFSRRDLLVGALALGAGVLPLARVRAGAPTPRSAGGKVEIEKFAASGDTQGVVEVTRVVKSDEQWRAQLSPLSFEVTRRAGTERAFSGEYAATHASGIYRCICCETALFDSRTKFASGTGWPSFYQPISKLNVRESGDHTLWDAASRRLVHALRRAPRPRFRRRTATDRASLLHELRGIEIRAQRRAGLMNTTTISRFRRTQLLLCMLTLSACAFAAERATVIPAPAVDNPKAAGPTQTTVLAGGCFWGVQGVFQHVPVCARRCPATRAATSARPNTEVGSGRTGHAESVQISSTRSRSRMANCCKSTSRSRTTRRNSTARGRTSALSTGRPSSHGRCAEEDRRGVHRATRPGEGLRAPDRHDREPRTRVLTRPRTTTRISWLNNPNNPYIVFNDLPKVRNLEKLFPRVYLRQPVTVYAASAGR